MRATVVDGVDRAVDVEDGDREISNVEHPSLARRHGIRVAKPHPFGHAASFGDQRATLIHSDRSSNRSNSSVRIGAPRLSASAPNATHVCKTAMISAGVAPSAEAPSMWRRVPGAYMWVIEA